MDHLRNYLPLHPTSLFIVKPSAPIAIPSRHNSTFPSPMLYGISCPSTTSSDLLFEMSPLDLEANCRRETTIHLPTTYVGEPSLPVDRVDRDAYVTRNSFLAPSWQRYLGYSAHSPTVDCFHPHSDLKKRRDSDHSIETEYMPPVIRTTAVHKISGFSPTNPTSSGSEASPRLQTQSTPSNSNSIFKSFGIHQQHHDNKSYDRKQ
ncbi:MAG: hypothetical protein NXY57DRAFT_1010303 [Lentinula lateritia]|nr:MAG: hypothetical protein NXY57DRAFT_1010303 [Lentinula lateritia]